MPALPRWLLSPVCAAALLAGCANPMLSIKAPGYSLAESDAPKEEPRSMAEAMKKLNHVRANYHEAIVKQAGDTQNTTTGLVWLGTLVAGAAVGGAHRDVVLGGSLIGGTTYGLSRSQLDARRMQIWLRGIQGLDCAKEASLPLDIGELRRRDLAQAIADLSLLRDGTRLALGTLRNEIEAAPKGAPPATVSAAKALAAAADTALADAALTRDAGTALLQASNGGELSATVDRIDAQVMVATNDIAVSLDSVKQMVGGLGGFASMFAPGAGIDATVSNALAAFAPAAKASDAKAESVVPTPALDDAVAALKRELAALARAQAGVSGLTTGVNLAAVQAALKKCDVAGVAAPITLTPAALGFDLDAAATKGFAIAGGTAPYEVMALDGLPDGLSIIFAGRFADTAQVKATKGVPEGSYRLQVSDSSAVKRSQQLLVRVAPKGAGAGDANAADKAADKPAPEADTAALWATLATAIGQRGTQGFAGVNVTVSKATPTATGVQVVLSCQPKKAVPAADLRDWLSAADKATLKQLRNAQRVDKDATQIDLSPSPDCVKP